jgi:hypothetical protein
MVGLGRSSGGRVTGLELKYSACKMRLWGFLAFRYVCACAILPRQWGIKVNAGPETDRYGRLKFKAFGLCSGLQI